MMLRIPTLVCGILLCLPISAQMPRDSFLIYGYDPIRLPLVDALFVAPSGVMTFRSWPFPMSSSTAVAIEDGEVLYFAVPSSLYSPNPGAYHFYRGTVGPNLTLQVTPLGTYSNPTNSLISALAVAGDILLFATKAAWLQSTTSLVGTLSKTQANQTVGTVLDLGQLGYPQTFIEARSNGRDVFLWGQGSATVPGAILVLDTSVTPPAVRSRPYVFHPAHSNGQLVGFASVTPSAFQFTLVDPWTGVVNPIPNAYYSFAPDSVAYNPWTRTLVIRDFGLIGSDIYILSPTTGQWLPRSTLQNGWGAFLLPIHEEPVLIYGRGCANATGRDPRMTWTGLPERSGQLTLSLLGSEPTSLVMFWLGTSRTTWAGSALPLDGATLGAPGCRLLAAPDVWQVTVSDAGGVANLPLQLPNDPVLVGLELFAQTGSATSINPFGFVTSDALRLRFR